MRRINRKPIEPVRSSIQPYERGLLRYPTFAMGMATAYDESSLPEGMFSAIDNFLIKNNGDLRARFKLRPLMRGSESTEEDGLSPKSFFLDTIGTIEWTLAAMNDGTDEGVQYLSGDGAWTELISGIAAGSQIEFLPFGINETTDILVAGLGATPQRIYDDSGTPTNGALGLAVPIVTSTTLASSTTDIPTGRGITIDSNETFYYRLTHFYDDSGATTKYGESGRSAELSETTSGGADTYKITLSSIPTPSGVSKTLVYRSPPSTQDGPFLYVGETTGSSFVDACPIGEEGPAEAPLDDGSPPDLQYIAEFNGRIVGFDADIPTKFVYSESSQPDYYPALNAYYLPEDGTGCVVWNRNLYLFTKTSTYIFADGDVTQPPVQVCKRGCVSHWSISDVGNGLFWASHDNFYWADFNTQSEDGDYPIPIGDPIQDNLELVPASRWKKIASEIFSGTLYVSLAVHGSNNDTTFAWNTYIGTGLLKQGKFGGWSRMDWSANYMASWNGAFYSSDPTPQYESSNINRYIYEHYETPNGDFWNQTQQDAGEYSNTIGAISSGQLDFNEPDAEKQPFGAGITCESSQALGSLTLTLDQASTYSRSVQFGSITEEVTEYVYNVSNYVNSTACSAISNDGAGGVRLTVTSNTGFAADDLVELYGTAGYDGTHTVKAVSSTTIVDLTTALVGTESGLSATLNARTALYSQDSKTRIADFIRLKPDRCYVFSFIYNFNSIRDLSITNLRFYYSRYPRKA